MPIDNEAVRTSKADDPIYIIGLDLIRFISAIFVIVLHFRRNGSNSPFVLFLNEKYSLGMEFPHYDGASFEYLGFLGVQIFFIISGLVTASSIGKFKSIGDYIARRFFRIFPTLLVCTIISGFICYLTGFFSASDTIGRALRDIVVSPFGPHLNDVVWTLSLEIAFYIAAIFIYVWCGKKLDILLNYLCIGSTIYWMFVIANSIFSFVDDSTMHVMAKIARNGLLEHGAYFSIGIMLFYLNLDRASFERNEHLIIPITISVVVNIYVSTIYFIENPQNIGAPKSPLLAILLIALFIFAIHFSIELRRFFVFIPEKFKIYLKFLGKLSYPMYLLHLYIGGYFAYLAVYMGVGYLATFSAIVGSIIASCIVTRFVEEPLSLVIKRMTFLSKSPAT